MMSMLIRFCLSFSRKYHFEHELRDMTWLIDMDDVKHRKTAYMSSMVAMSVVSVLGAIDKYH